MSIVRDNMLSRKGYSGYCGADKCSLHWPRTYFDPKVRQLRCPCGFQTDFEPEFIDKYVEFQGEDLPVKFKAVEWL